MISAVDRSVGAQEVACEPSGLHLLCVVEPGLNILVLLPSQTVTPLSPGRGGARAGAAGVRDVCGPESDMPCPPCVCFITSKAKLKEFCTELGSGS